jgi:hypothetical protein
MYQAIDLGKPENNKSWQVVAVESFTVEIRGKGKQ